MLRFVMARASVVAVAGLALVMTACGPAATDQAAAPTDLTENLIFWNAPLPSQGSTETWNINEWDLRS